MADKMIASFQKNPVEEVRISLTTFKKKELIDVRVYVDIDEKGFVPTKKGITLPIGLLSKLLEGLQAAAGEARKRDWID